MNVGTFQMSAVKSSLRTLLIFELFAERLRPLALAEIARDLEMPKSSCLALLTTLSERGYLVRAARDGSYYPSRRWQTQANRVAESDPLSRHIHESLVRLRDASGETAIHAALAGDRSTYLDVVESTEIIRYTARAGDLKPLNASASGRAQLGALEPAAREAVFDRLAQASTSGRLGYSRRALEQLVSRERQRGWSINLGEYRPDVISIAVGFDLNGSAHSLVIAAPYPRLETRVDKVGQTLQREVNALMQRLS